MDSLISPPCGVPGMELRSPDLCSKCSHLLSRPADPIAFISILFLPFFGGLWCCFEIQSHTVVQDGLKLMAILLPQALKCQRCGHEWPCPAILLPLKRYNFGLTKAAQLHKPDDPILIPGTRVKSWMADSLEPGRVLSLS